MMVHSRALATAALITFVLTGCGPSPSANVPNESTSDRALEEGMKKQADMLAQAAAHDSGGDMGVTARSAGETNELETDSSYAAAKQNIANALKDSSSARFKDMFVSRLPGGNLVLCGKVNSKNSFGGYTGYKGFIAHPDPAVPPILEDETGAYGVSDPENLYAGAYQQFCTHVVERY